MTITRRSGAALLGRIPPRRIGARLYGLAALALVTVMVLAAAAITFVTLAGETARDIRNRVEVELGRVNEIDLLLERHRRIIESAPVELDLDRLLDLRRKHDDLMHALGEHIPNDGSAFAANLKARLPVLAAEGSAALHLAENYAQTAAIDQVEVYAAVARALQREVEAHKSVQLAEVDGDVTRIVASGRQLTGWVIAGTVAALVLIGPFSLMVTREIVRRLRAMTATMLRLAANDTGVHVSGTRYPDELGDMARALGVFKANAVALLAYQRDIEALNQRFEFALEHMSRGLSMFDAERRLIVCNSRYRALYGVPGALARPGTPFEDIMAHRISTGTGRAGETLEARLPWPFDDDRGEQSLALIQLTHNLIDGRIVEIAFQPLNDGGWVALHEDVTAARLQEARIERLAHIDTVTGTANRHAFQEALDEALVAMRQGAGFGVHWLDLDRFKDVNDTFGHPVGDALLRLVAARIQGAVRSCDFVARLGGDEFAVIQRGVADADDAETLAARLIPTLSAPYEIDGHRVDIGASVGVVIAPRHGETAEDLIRHADIALYQAKALGRGRHVVFDAGLEQELKLRRDLAADLGEAISTDAFMMHYQPILDLKRGGVGVCEALLRWAHPTLGQVSPAVIIKVAEETGAIIPLGAWALRRACRDALGWPGDIKVAVNLSAVQFAHGDLVAMVAGVLEETGLDPRRLELEITETVLLSDDAATIGTLHTLRAMGISIALDDFGTGYSSLSYLRRFPFDKIKIDQTFIRDLPSRTECVAIVRAVADLAKTLGMITVAEGVETADHLQRVAAAGCDQVQGYLISRPVPIESLPAAIALAGENTFSAAA